MNRKIEEALNYLENAEIGSYFELMDYLIRNSPTYSRLKREFISGKIDFDYYDRLRVYALAVNKELFQDNNMRNIPPIDKKRKNVFVLYGYSSSEVANDVIKRLLKKSLFNIITIDELVGKPNLRNEIINTIQEADAYLLFIDDSFLTSITFFNEIINNINEQCTKYAKKCVLVLVEKNIFLKKQPSFLAEENITVLKKVAHNTNALQINLEDGLEEKLSLLINTIKS